MIIHDADNEYKGGNRGESFPRYRGRDLYVFFTLMVPAGCSLTVKTKHQGPTFYAKRKPILNLTPEEKQAPVCLRRCFVPGRQDYLLFYMTWLHVTHLSSFQESSGVYASLQGLPKNNICRTFYPVT